MTIRPLYDQVLLKRKDPEATTRSGLFIPESATKKSQFAEVVAVGSGRFTKDGELRPLKVEPGMTVLLSSWAGTEVQIEGEEHLVLREDDILAAVF